MAKLRFVGDRPMEVFCNGHPRGGRLGIVEPDQLLEVPDEVFLAHAWPETLWSEVEVPDREEPKELEQVPTEESAAAADAVATEDEPAPSFGRKSRTASEKE